MNAQNNSSTEDPTSYLQESDQKPQCVKTKISLKAELYREINKQLFEMSAQLGFKISLSNFLQKTIADHWKDQVEYYQKLEKGLKRTRQ